MQAVKDSFYMALRARLAAVNPSRVTGETARTALLVAENESDEWLAKPDVFYLRWLGNGAVSADAVAAGWRGLRCEIAYRTEGSELARGEDRGRVLAQLDGEFRAIATPRSAILKDYTAEPATELGAILLWTSPKFADVKEDAKGLQRTVEIDILWREDA